MSFLNNELQEKNFIQKGKNSFPGWVWLVVIICLGAIFWGSSSWYTRFMSSEVAKNPFLQVTNRQFSIFLWQFPEYMRVNSSSKSTYLPGFQYEHKISLNLSDSDKYVVAPPEILFLYHTWDRLIREEIFFRPIAVSEFKEFLEYASEWQPKYWKEAPLPFAALVNSLFKDNTSTNSALFSENELPLDVRQAFQGWKNYFKEGKAINDIKPTREEVNQFLRVAPHYARNYWRNILQENYPHYLSELQLDNSKAGPSISNEDLAPFLRVALYNFLQSQSPQKE